MPEKEKPAHTCTHMHTHAHTCMPSHRQYVLKWAKHINVHIIHCAQPRRLKYNFWLAWLHTKCMYFSYNLTCCSSFQIPCLFSTSFFFLEFLMDHKITGPLAHRTIPSSTVCLLSVSYKTLRRKGQQTRTPPATPTKQPLFFLSLCQGREGKQRQGPRSLSAYYSRILI